MRKKLLGTAGILFTMALVSSMSFTNVTAKDNTFVTDISPDAITEEVNEIDENSPANVAARAAGNYTNSNYTYDYKTDGDYKDTNWRNKNCDITNDGIHGYGYAMSSNGDDSKVRMYGRNDSNPGSATTCSGWVPLPHYRHTNINNTFLKSKQNQAKLRIKSSPEKGVTYGVWSPDSSKKYEYIGG